VASVEGRKSVARRHAKLKHAKQSEITQDTSWFVKARGVTQIRTFGVTASHDAAAKGSIGRAAENSNDVFSKN